MIKNILRFHKLMLYYHYRWQKSMGDVGLEYGAVTVNSTVLMLYIFDLHILGIRFCDFYLFGKMSKGPFLTTGFIVIALNYFFFAAKGKFQLIIDEFENVSKQQDKKRKIIAILYSLGAWVLFGISLYLSKH